MNQDQQFEEWMAQVNVYLNRLCGLSADDLPDWNYRDAFDDDVSPLEAARDVIQAAKDY